MTRLFDDIDNAYVYADTDNVIARQALDNLMRFSNQFDALAPKLKDWAEAPEWAQWYAIDPWDSGYWFDIEPLITYDNETYDAPTWANNSLCDFADHIGLLPFGIDWRLCKWQRPVQP